MPYRPNGKTFYVRSAYNHSTYTPIRALFRNHMKFCKKIQRFFEED